MKFHPFSKGVANFKFIFHSHLCTNFESFDAYLAALMLNFLKHTNFSTFWWISEELWPFFLDQLFLVHPVDMELFMYWGQEYILQKYTNTNTSINWLDIFFLLFSFKFPGLSVIILLRSGAGRFDRKMCLHFTKVFDNYLNILSRDIKCQLNFETSI